MNRDLISEIGIDDRDRLYVIPESSAFPHIYREGMEVHWDGSGGFLYSPMPREWSYSQWLLQILNAAREQDCELLISERTRWHNISPENRREMLSLTGQ